MLEANGVFWLFYSANLWGSENYGIGLAADLCGRALYQTT